jgi:peptidoglycan/LPS O-acetylase OafA/YrhL
MPRALAWGIPAAALVASTALAASSLSQKSPSVRLAVLLGDASYALYLVHPIALGAVRRILPAVVEASVLAYSMAAIACCIAAALLIHRIAEKPVTRALQARVDRLTQHGQRGNAMREQVPTAR